MVRAQPCEAGMVLSKTSELMDRVAMRRGNGPLLIYQLVHGEAVPIYLPFERRLFPFLMALPYPSTNLFSENIISTAHGCAILIY